MILTFRISVVTAESIKKDERIYLRLTLSIALAFEGEYMKNLGFFLLFLLGHLFIHQTHPLGKHLSNAVVYWTIGNL